MTHRFGFITLGLLAVLTGCGERDTPKSTATKGAPPRVVDEPAVKSAAVELKVVKHPQLADALKANKGNIVVMDLWASWCVPCKKEFHHLVELNKKYQADGVKCVSLSLDEADSHEPALKFLQDKGATFANYRLDDTIESCQDKWKFTGIPVVVVYGRDGAIARTFTMDDPDNQFTYADVEKLVRELVAKK